MWSNRIVRSSLTMHLSGSVVALRLCTPDGVIDNIIAIEGTALIVRASLAEIANFNSRLLSLFLIVGIE